MRTHQQTEAEPTRPPRRPKPVGGLRDDERARFEHSIGADLSTVRIHPNSSLPRAVDADAVTRGEHVHIAPGAMSKRVVAHELAHVVQQRSRAVPATAFVGPHAVNTDPSLERAADVAAHRVMHGSPASTWSRAAPSQSAVLQCTKFNKALRVVRPRWEALLEIIEEYADKVRPFLDDDDEVELLDELVGDADMHARQAQKADEEARIRPLRPQLMRPARKATRKYQLAQKVRGPNKTYREYWADERDRYLKFLRRDYAELKATFPLRSGGFGAKGRAHSDYTMGAQVLEPDDDIPDDHVADDSFTTGITIDGHALSDDVVVAKSQATVGDAAGPAIVRGQQIDTETADRGAQLTAAEQEMDNLSANDSNRWSAHFDRAPPPRDRGAGQYASMGNTNATGYAWAANVGGWQHQRWEWLHVRAASLRGYTDGTNLVVGTRDANTHMIPFESNVRTLAGEVHDNDNFERLDVWWDVAERHNPARHAVDTIRLRWTLVPANDDVDEHTGEARFRPLATGANISKAEVGAIEEALKTVRDDLP